MVELELVEPLPALRRVDLTVPQGKMVAVIGEHGTGRGTFLQLLAGVLVPQKGAVLNLQSDYNLCYHEKYWMCTISPASADRVRVDISLSFAKQNKKKTCFVILCGGPLDNSIAKYSDRVKSKSPHQASLIPRTIFRYVSSSLPTLKANMGPGPGPGPFLSAKTFKNRPLGKAIFLCAF